MGGHGRLYSEAAYFGAIRAASIASSFVSIGLAAHHLSTTDFTLVVALGSFYASVNIVDTGVGLVAQEAASRQRAPADAWVWWSAARSILRTEAWLVPVLVLVAFQTSRPFLVMLCGALGLVSVPLALVERAHAFRQQMSVSAAAAVGASVVCIGASWTLVQVDHALWIAIVPISVSVLSYLIQWWWTLLPDLRSARRPDLLMRFSRGKAAMYLVAQVSVALTFNADIYFLTLLTSAHQALGFPAAYRLATAGGAVLGSVVQAIWPYVASVGAGRDLLRSIAIRAVGLLGLMSFALALGGVLALSGALDLLTRFVFADKAPDRVQLALVFGLLAVFVLADGCQQLMFAMGRLKRLAVGALLNVGVKLAVGPLLIWQVGPFTTMPLSAAVLTAGSTVPCLLVLFWRSGGRSPAASGGSPPLAATISPGAMNDVEPASARWQP